MIKRFKNYGVIPEIRDTDYIGGTLPYKVNNESGDWTPYVPKGENQYSNMVDSMACVSFSFLNCLETLLKHRTTQEFDFSDRFLAKMSNTTTQGNTLGIVADSYRKYGCPVETDWPKPDNFTWDTFYAEIPQEVKDKALKYNISYEWVDTDVASLQFHLKQSPLQLIIPGHAICGIYEQDDIFKYFDTYNPYLKEHANPPLHALKIVLNNMNLTKEQVHLIYALWGLNDPTGEAYWVDKTLNQLLEARKKDVLNNLNT